jgi:N-methylhydantoinase A
LAVEKPALRRRAARAPASAPAIRRVHVSGAWRETPVYPRSSLTRSARSGPALLIDYGSTTLVPPGWQFSLDPFGNLKIAIAEKP